MIAKKKKSEEENIRFEGANVVIGKTFSQRYFFRNFKDIEIFLNGTTHFHCNSLIVHKKTNSTIYNMLTLA